MRRLVVILLPVILLLLASKAGFSADGQAFDLAGPKVDVHVQRDGKTLPIAEVPSLQPGDRLWIHPDFPESQSAHYVLIVAFLRGVTNPPPPEWFKRVETWTRAVREEGVFVVVPAEAQQALIFLAPETTGDFNTLRKAVHDRPGAFVRAGQDLQQASWDRLRLDAYLAEVKAESAADPKELKERTALAARSLGMRLDQQCFDKPSEQQAPCLVQHTEGLVLDDSNAQSLVNQMANGSAADMMNQLSYAPLAGAGAFSPYVGAIVDLAKILSTIHTAKYQYIPALALPQKDTLNLRLNVPPSFRDPKSVIVVALPPVFAATAAAGHQPQMHAVDGAQGYCAQKPGLVLLAEGAPLVFATPLAHDLTLQLEGKGGPLDIPVKADPALGGLVLEKPLPAEPEAEVAGALRGKWGFDDWEGPKFHLRAARAGAWTVPASERNALIIGREDIVHIQGESTLCVAGVEARIGDHKPEKLVWKSSKPDLLEVTVPLKDATPGTVTLAIHQFGLEDQTKPEELALKAYAEAASLDRLTLSAGDKVAVLKGKRLDEVSAADLAGISFAPVALNRVEDFDRLEMIATGATSTLTPGNSYSAKITLRDGRQLNVSATVEPPRPQVDLLSKGVQHAETDTPSPVHLGSTADLPLQGRLVFFLRSRVPAAFSRTEKIELAAVDGSFGTTLSLADGSLMLEDAHTAVAVLDPLARFGASAFGPLQLRAVSAEGVAGDWVQLGTLVRLPGFPVTSALRCPRNPAKPCMLTGINLFLVSAVGSIADMSNAVDIAPDFTGNALVVPNTARVGSSETLYLRLRDDPDTVQVLTLPVLAAQPVAGGSSATPDLGAPAEAAPTANPATQTPGPASSQAPVPAPPSLLCVSALCR